MRICFKAQNLTVYVMPKCHSAEANFLTETLQGTSEACCWFDVWSASHDSLGDCCACEGWYSDSIHVNTVSETKCFTHHEGSFRSLGLRTHCLWHD